MEAPNEEQLQPERKADAQVDSESQDDPKPMLHDSMVTVRLSEPPNLTVDTNISETDKRKSIADSAGEGTASVEIIDEEEESPRITMMDPNGNEVASPSGSESAGSQDGQSRRGSDSSELSAGEVNWEELEKTEEQEPRDSGSDDVRSSHTAWPLM
jgi:hypothetical protein